MIERVCMFLGVDGGGTKTAFVLIDALGNCRATHDDVGSYYPQIGLTGVADVFERGIQAVIQQANIAVTDIDYAFFGIPAFGENSAVDDALRLLPSRFLALDKYTCGNDMICAWAGSLACTDGINIIAGTGAIAYGEYKQQTARCGGWGELFGDEGSAYWIGRAGLTLFSKMSDGRLCKGLLYDIFRSHFSFNNDLELSGLVHNEWLGERDKIAQVSKLVAQAALQGDLAALAVFNLAAKALAEQVIATYKQLHFTINDTVTISYSGGVFNAVDIIMASFQAYLTDGIPRYDLIKPKHSPVVGAALYAARCSGCAIRF